MTKYEKQPDYLPTNKMLVTGLLSSVIAPNIAPVVSEIWPQLPFIPPYLAGDAMTAFVTNLASVLVSFVVAWFVPDRAGTVG